MSSPFDLEGGEMEAKIQHKDIIFDLELGSGRKQTQRIRRKKTTKRNDT